jgi:ADP-ribose pyrophosphatase YjhB (NUDIX family)
MKQAGILFWVLIVATTSSLFGQNNGNSHFFKLLVFNDNQKILLIKFDGSWEIPGARYNTNTTIPVFIDKMAKDHGISIENSKLAAFVTFHHEIRDYPTMMFYYRAQYISGDLSTPSWGQEVKWFSLDDAYKIIPYQEMNYIIKSIIAEKELLTGALRIEYDEKTSQRTGQFDILDDLKN